MTPETIKTCQEALEASKSAAALQARGGDNTLEERLAEAEKEILLMESRAQTQEHIERVGYFLGLFCDALAERARVHDQSKLESPEAEVFAEVTSKLKALTYGSDEYKAQLKEMGPALEHHYVENSHNTEYWVDNNIEHMDLLDIVEMMADWRAAGERHADGNIFKSIDHNVKRFGLSFQLASIFENTAVRLFKDEGECNRDSWEDGDE